MDFTPISVPLVFTTSPDMICADINITDDNIVEDMMEQFTVRLSQSDPAILLIIDTANVTIIDEDGWFVESKIPFTE